MTDEEKSEISFIVCTIYGILLHFTLFCWKISFFFVNLRCFVAKLVFAIYALLCGEKMTNIRYVIALTVVIIDIITVTVITSHCHCLHHNCPQKIVRCDDCQNHKQLSDATGNLSVATPPMK